MKYWMEVEIEAFSDEEASLKARSAGFTVIDGPEEHDEEDEEIPDEDEVG